MTAKSHCSLRDSSAHHLHASKRPIPVQRRPSAIPMYLYVPTIELRDFGARPIYRTRKYKCMDTTANGGEELI